ncbi:MAG: hypothetical protein HYV60_21490 [Planctomycetia bacterium]|nr:hypothetical protein [Planctomycetia bacterium]
MQTTHFVLSLLLMGTMAVVVTPSAQAQDRQGDAATQADQPDDRYLIYVRGIT